MTFTTFTRAVALALAAAACTLPAHADSVASSASSAGSASSASISDSIGGSSNSSSGDRRRVTTGPYRVIDIAQAPAKADTTRVTLRAVAGDAATEFWVDVPDRALADRRIAKDEVVQVNERVYGYEFAYGDTKKAFFLALQDDWYRELASRKVTI
ncbi:hypothetical protein HAV22_23615 [Massilia sp. TW-1]|uniref:Uncharacterized protein n=1 Tax=Telluria antibiotica TaxID=2717319 RepID=A0ABX0PGP4_9BURK|nr:hypothetical protein [Telluria antibiotica]NIA56616.1 hypothetical protein [Telluria antibiotica]